MEWYYVWWPWLTSKRVAQVCQHQLSFFSKVGPLAIAGVRFVMDNQQCQRRDSSIVVLRVVISDRYPAVSRSRHRRASELPSLMDLQCDGDGLTSRRDAEVYTALVSVMMTMKVKVHTLDIAPLHSESPPQKHSGMARILKGFKFLPAHPHVHPQSEWAIPAFASPAAAGIHVPTLEGWKAE